MVASVAAPVASPLRLRLFGPFEVEVSGRPLPRLRSRKGSWLLALLALRHDRDVERSWLAGTLWPDTPEPRALISLRVSLRDLRHALGPEAHRLRSPTPHTVCLSLAGADADLVAFDAAIAGADASSLEAAVRLHRGMLLEGWTEEWVFQERQPREEAYLQALERLADEAQRRGDAGASARWLRQAVGADPLRESAQRVLMQALAAGGEYAAALETYRELRLLLHRELNAEPDAETRQLFDQIRAKARSRAQVPTTDHRPPTTDQSAVGGGRWSVVGRQPSEGTVTFLFTDIEGSTKLWERHPDEMREAMARHDALLRAALEGQGGHVFKTVGDQFCAAFATAPDALAAAVAAQRALLDFGLRMANGGLNESEATAASPNPKSAIRNPKSIRVRMALYTGVAEERGGDYSGPALNRVARLLEAGHSGQVLLSLATQELACDDLPAGTSLRDLGEHRLKDLTRPERIFQLVTPDLPADFPPLNTLGSRRHNLPLQLTTFIGREQEMEELARLLELHRMFTLTGPGGSGKTRLALQVAAHLTEEFADGVFFVVLAPITDPGLVVSAISQTLGVREAGSTPLLESVKEFLREKHLLLVLDNFEQILEAAPLIPAILAAAPRLKVLVTSRAMLHVQGEREFPVPPLALPSLPTGSRVKGQGSRIDGDQLDPRPSTLDPQPSTLLQYAAVALFLERAAAVKPEFALTEENAPAIVEICRRLDGLPLAIELAAARVKLLTPQALLSRLESWLKLLTGGARDAPGRHQTLRATIDWSYNLLEAEEKKLFHRLSVFAGGCTLEAAEAVCAGGEVVGSWEAEPTDAARPSTTTSPPHHLTLSPLEIDILDGITSLVDNSLLQQEETAFGARLRMLETIREYAWERLQEAGEAEAVRRRHLGFFLQLMEEAELHRWRAGMTASLDRMAWEHDNLRAVLGWSLIGEDGGQTGLHLACLLSWYWSVRGYFTEGREWLAKLLARCSEGRSFLCPPALRAAGYLAYEHGDVPAARVLYEEMLAASRELGNDHGIADALYCVGGVAAVQGDLITARAFCEESLTMARALGNNPVAAWSLYYLAVPAGVEGDLARARACLEEGLELLQGRGVNFYHLGALGSVVGAQGDLATARSLCEESLAIGRERGHKRAIAWSLSHLGDVAGAQGDTATARELFEESLVILKELGHRAGIAKVLEGFASVAAAQGRAERAARLLGASEAAREWIDYDWWQPLSRTWYGQELAAVRAARDEASVAAAWEEGRVMTLDSAIREALE